MRRNIFIIHGSYGSPKENWFPWLKKELEKLGHKVFVPHFPHRFTNSSLTGHFIEDWMEVFREYRKYVNEKTIFIAHSRGSVFLYHLLPTLSHKIDSVFMVAPYLIYHWYAKEYKETDEFQLHPINWPGIKKSAHYFEIFQSSNDDSPIFEGQEIARNLGAKLTIVKNAGHFNVSYDPSFKQFPMLLDKIKSRL